VPKSPRAMPAIQSRYCS